MRAYSCTVLPPTSREDPRAELSLQSGVRTSKSPSSWLISRLGSEARYPLSVARPCVRQPLYLRIQLGDLRYARGEGCHGADSGGWRLAFRTDVDHDSEVMPISVFQN